MMVRLRCLGLAALALWLDPAVAQSDRSRSDPLLQPSGKWVVDFSETHCTAARAYGNEADSVLLAFRPSVAEDLVRLTIVRPGGISDIRRSPVTVDILGASIPASGLRFPSEDRRKEVVWIHLDEPSFESLRMAQEMAIDLDRGIRLRFALEEMQSVVQLLKECNADLRGHWNVSDASRVEIERPAVPIGPSNWLTDADYPAAAQREGASGIVKFILMVDEAGVVQDCSVEGTSGSALLDATGCVRLLERARFRPALDVGGNPVRSVFRSRIVWRLP